MPLDRAWLWLAGNLALNALPRRSQEAIGIYLAKCGALASCLILPVVIGFGVLTPAPVVEHDPTARLARLPAVIYGMERSPAPEVASDAATTYKDRSYSITIRLGSSGNVGIDTESGMAPALEQAVGAWRERVLAQGLRVSAPGPQFFLGELSRRPRRSVPCLPFETWLPDGSAVSSAVCLGFSWPNVLTLEFTGPSGGLPRLRRFFDELRPLI